MSRVQLALRVADLEGSIAFYTRLFGAEPAKRRPGYANFAIAEPPAQARPHPRPARRTHPHGPPRRRSPDTGEVTAATARLAPEVLPTATEEDTALLLRRPGPGLGPGPGDEP
jgi:catechol 2,3-dioxygenase-like lactoylglutathione lyase family enzyme